MSWKPEVLVQGQWSQNALVFATQKEAQENAWDLRCRWILVDDCRAVEVDDPVNYSFVDGVLVEVKKEA